MDYSGQVNVTQVELVDKEFNEGMNISKQEPGVKLLDIFGGDKNDDIGQRQSPIQQHSMTMVALKQNPNGSTSVIRKHYTGGIFTPDHEKSDADNSSS